MKMFPRIVRFFGAGCGSALAHYSVLISLVQALGVNPVAASVAGALVGGIVNYVLNYRFTFRSENSHLTSGPRFVIAALVGMTLNALFMWTGVEWLGMHYLLAQLLTTGLVFLWSYNASRLWTFRPRIDLDRREGKG
jgi:putative flippase GtrA